MADKNLYLFWVLITALFVFAMVYTWFIAIIVRKELAGTLTWMLAGLVFITGVNAFIRSEQSLVTVESLVIVQRGIWLMTALTACSMAVQLGIQYNGKVSERIPLKRQWRMLRSGILQKSKGAKNGPEARAGSDCG